LTDHHCLHTLYSNKWTWATDDVSLFRAAAFINTRSSTSDGSYNTHNDSLLQHTAVNHVNCLIFSRNDNDIKKAAVRHPQFLSRDPTITKGMHVSNTLYTLVVK